MVMAMGGMLGLLGVGLPGTEIGIASSAILLGGAVMSEMRPPLTVAAVVVAFFAIFHGYAHGAELPPGQNGLLYSMGFVIATGCLHAIGITIGVIHRWLCGQKLLRVAGGAVALAGVVFMWKSFLLNMSVRIKYRVATASAILLEIATCALPAEAHLNSTGLGPI